MYDTYVYYNTCCCIGACTDCDEQSQGRKKKLKRIKRWLDKDNTRINSIYNIAASIIIYLIVETNVGTSIIIG